MGKLYEEQLARQAAREEFLERTFNATTTDAVRNLLTSDNIYEGKDTRNLDQYLIERQYDLSAIIAGSATVPDDIFKPTKNPDARAASKNEMSRLCSVLWIILPGMKSKQNMINQLRYLIILSPRTKKSHFH